MNSPSDSPSDNNSPSKGKVHYSKGKGFNDSYFLQGRSTGSHSLTPVTIKQLGQAVQIGDAFKVDGVELNMVRFL